METKNPFDSVSLKRSTNQQSSELYKRWKPSNLEITILKTLFQNNQSPKIEEKEVIIKNFQNKFNSEVSMAELTQWFQDEKEELVKKDPNEFTKGIYRKFQRQEHDQLNQSFLEDNYPKTTKMAEMAKKMDCSLSKIENWYKQKRKKEAKEGFLTLKTKKSFKKDELEYLSSLFGKESFPTRKEIVEIAKKLNCSSQQIKNWYSNKRKKLRLFRNKSSSQRTGNAPLTLELPPSESTKSPFDYVTIPTCSQPQALNPESFQINQSVPTQSIDFEKGYFRPQTHISGIQPISQVFVTQNIANAYPHPYPNSQDENNKTNLSTRNITAINNFPCIKMIIVPVLVVESHSNSNFQNNSYFPSQTNLFSFSNQQFSNLKNLPTMYGSQISLQSHNLTQASYDNVLRKTIPDESFETFASPNKRLFVAKKAL